MNKRLDKPYKRIDVHADDYALSMNVSRTILQCIKDGEIDSISVMPNMSIFDEAMDDFAEFEGDDYYDDPM